MSGAKQKPFIVKDERAFGALRHWLKEHGCNTYSWSRRDRIQVGYDARPDSDWGKYECRGYIIVQDEKLFDRTCAAIEKALGWPQDAATDKAVAG